MSGEPRVVLPPPATSSLDDRACWVPDAGLDERARAFLQPFVTPRRGLDGEWYWPVDELGEADG